MKGSSPIYKPLAGPLVLAFDVEKLGQFSEHPVIEIGACVMGPYPSCTRYEDYSYSVLDMALLDTRIYPVEWRCMDAFWNKDENKPILEAIAHDSNKDSPVELERLNMISGFVHFMAQWEAYATANRIELWRTTDNKAYDPACINQMIERYLPGTMTLPFHMNNGKYGAMPETHSMQWAILLTNPASSLEFRSKTTGLSRGILRYYDHSPCPVKHTHRALDDAYGVAYDMQVCLAIAEGRVKPRPQPLSEEEVEYMLSHCQ